MISRDVHLVKEYTEFESEQNEMENIAGDVKVGRGIDCAFEML